MGIFHRPDGRLIDVQLLGGLDRRRGRTTISGTAVVTAVVRAVVGGALGGVLDAAVAVDQVAIAQQAMLVLRG